ncbi:WD40 repeat domain-containing serine/threonine protein kinase [Rhodopirellula sp. MGV]|uniref:WD40 repeat domain-containing serine/threonine protein kinase n=1 Tax=Rhodopirellula sp. MGV TaxID=2023130 RepID=UPI000B96C7F4|nr:serine/threonine-protein kinase [Rhodopirellula sp. MGV]OYP34608.1 serine/threonine protein kinase [Rhodopirellula sp. MGV]PNY37336.1 serine/threonine protein kinase [Rhodopirellula baltica]
MSRCSCPCKKDLEALVNGQLSNERAEETTEHVGQCTECQHVIEEVAIGELQEEVHVPIEALVGEEVTALPPSESAYWKAVSNISMQFDIAAKAVSDSDSYAQPIHDTSIEVKRVTGSEQTSDADPGPTIETPAAIKLPFLKPSDDAAYIGRLNHFEIARIIGRGGMGIVLEAFDTHLQRTVAIKVLNPEYDKNDVARQRFCREARAAAAISHEHVVAMHNVAKEDEGGIAFLVMQYIEGETLEKHLSKSKPLPPADAARIAMQIAAGLAAAHEREMVHRDIKPANILLERSSGRVKLTDFGLARATDDVRLTKTGMVTGTPLYMSPEQATGAGTDERSDLFSLGAVMYEMLTGKSAFEAPSIVGVMKRIMDETPPAPNKLNPAVNNALSELTMALLEKNPYRRPESAAFVAQTLAEIVSSIAPFSPLQVPSIGSTTTKRVRGSGTHRLVSKNTLRAAWAAGAVGVFSLLLAIGLWASGGFEPSDPTASANFPSTVLAGNPGTVWSVDFDPVGGRVAAAIEDGSVRLWDINTQKVLRSFEAHRGIAWTIQFHPERRLVATSGDDGLVKLWDADSLEPIREWNAGSSVRKVSFSPNGSKIVAGDRNGNVHVWSVDTGEELASVAQEGSIFSVAWSGDGRLIATVGSDKEVRVYDAETLETRQTMHGHPGPIYDVAFAPTNNLLATVGWGKAMFMWNTATGELENELIDEKGGDNWSVSFCADGSHAVVAGNDGKCRIWDLATNELVSSLSGHASAVHNVSLDKGRYQIATSGRDGTIRVWNLTGIDKQ